MMERQSGAILATMIALSSAPATAQDDRFQIGLRGNVLLGDGVPANDILGFGLIGRYALSDGWFAAATLDAYEYDFEHPASLLGIQQDPNVKTIDASTSNTVLGGHFGRRYGEADGGFGWFWSLGLGVAFPDIKDAMGPVAGGGTFDLYSTSKTEIHVMSALGSSYRITPAWSVALAARLEHQFIDITVTDRISGATGKVDSQSPIGAWFGINYQF